MTIVDEEADRITRLVTLHRARAYRFRTYRPQERISTLSVKSSLRPPTISAVSSTAENPNGGTRAYLPFVHADKAMTELTHAKILNNAVKYSPAGSEIAIRARQEVNSC